MNARNEFDDLARRKLEERQFAFDEAAWLEVQRTLDTERRRGGAWRWWTLAGAAVLLIGIAIWWNASDKGPDEAVRMTQVDPQASTGPTETRQETVAANENVSTDPAPAFDRVGATDATDPIAVEPEEPSPVVSSHEPEISPRHQEPVAAPRSEPTSIAVATSNAQEPDHATPEVPAVIPAALPVVVNDPHANEQPVTQVNDLTGVQPPEVEDGASRAEVAPVVAVMVAEQEITSDGIVSNEGATNNEGVAPTEEATAPPTPSEDVVLPPETTAEEQPVVENVLSATANDSSATAPAAPAPPVLVPAQAPWEISSLGGMLLGSSNYTGANSEVWKDDVESLWAPGFGAELMHMGRNFGLGAGLHYTTYAEHLQMAQQTVTETLTSDSNYFHPTPMMILIITDVVVIDGVTYYVTETLDTTINVLVRSTMTTTGERVVVQARDQVNRVSYFEIPVLFDAHLVQGPWSLGLRGGPMIGLLSGRRGAVPNETMDGYTEFSEQQFSEVVFGYTARAYIRYRFSDAWSVGVEPAIKGQLGNGLSGGDLARRNTAFGGMLSVSYRLR